MVKPKKKVARKKVPGRPGTQAPKKQAPKARQDSPRKRGTGKKAPVITPKLQAPIGRPLLDVDVEKLKQLAGLGLSSGEIAAVLDCSIDTLERRFMDVMETGRLLRNASLRRKQFEVATNGNATMLIWLGKQFLGQKDKLEHSGGVTLEGLVCGEREEE
jgi:hypothetical protein